MFRPDYRIWLAVAAALPLTACSAAMDGNAGRGNVPAATGGEHSDRVRIDALVRTLDDRQYRDGPPPGSGVAVFMAILLLRS